MPTASPPFAQQLKADRLDGFVVPLTDEHMSEYVGSYAQRLAWLTGFQGSAGSAVVLPEEAAIFIDGRYTIQVRQQVGADRMELPVGARDQHRRLAEGAMRRTGRGSATIPWLHTADWVQAGDRSRWPRRAPSWSRSSATRSTRSGPTGPSRRKARLVVQPDELCRQDRRPRSATRWPTGWSRKAPTRRCSRRSIRSPGRSTCAAQDVTHTPVALAFALVNADGTADLFVEGEKIGDDVRAHLGNGVRLHERDEFEPYLRSLERQDGRGRSRAVGGGDLARRWTRAARAISAARDPAVLPKAIKNEVEIAGHQAAQARDGAAVSRFLHWVEEEAPKGELDEIDRRRTSCSASARSSATSRI